MDFPSGISEETACRRVYNIKESPDVSDDSHKHLCGARVFIGRWEHSGGMRSLGHEKAKEKKKKTTPLVIQ